MHHDPQVLKLINLLNNVPIEKERGNGLYMNEYVASASQATPHEVKDIAIIPVSLLHAAYIQQRQPLHAHSSVRRPFPGKTSSCYRCCLAMTLAVLVTWRNHAAQYLDTGV